MPAASLVFFNVAVVYSRQLASAKVEIFYLDYIYSRICAPILIQKPLNLNDDL